MSNINTRSPYIISIDEIGQVETKVELFIWNGTGGAPSTPNYTLSKLIASSVITATNYDLSPYISEFINHNLMQGQPSNSVATPTGQWCNVKIKKYKRVLANFVQVGTDETLKAFDGYGYFTDGSNPILSGVLLNEGSYYYDPNQNVGWVTLVDPNIVQARWDNLTTLAFQEVAITPNTVRDISRVYTGWKNDGNKLVFRDVNDDVLWTGYFYPKVECKYQPIQVDFINRYGAFQREFFFKASTEKIKVENKEYNLMPSVYPNYYQSEGQRKIFNANGSKTIELNTDWVDESYSDTIQQLMLSERVLVNSLPAKLNTKSTELYKHINKNLINYKLDFEFNFDLINSVI